MKNKGLIFAFISLFLLTGCDIISETTYSKTVDVYDLNTLSEKPALKTHFIMDEELIPYVSLNDFDKLYAPYYKATVTTNIINDRYQSTWSFYENQSLIAYIDIDLTYQIIEIAGSVSSAFKGDDDSSQDQSTVMLGMKMNTEAYRRGNNIKNLTFQYYDFSYFKVDRENKFPLGLLNAVLRQESLPGLFYDYKTLYVYSDDAQLNTKLDIKGEQKSVFDLAKDNVAGMVMPEYLRRYNREVFIFNMENYYGLASTRGIKSMRTLILNSNNADLLLSENSSIRGQGLYNIIEDLSDGHTSLRGLSTIWDEKISDQTMSKLWEERVYLRSCLLKARNDHLLEKAREALTLEEIEQGLEPEIGDVYVPEYSSDGKVAKVYFDSFAIARDAYDKDGNLKEEAYTQDTFLQLSRQFQMIKAKGGVEKVIIDLSVNGGGIVATLMKVLALISKNNTGNVYFHNEEYNQVIAYRCLVDSNLDGEYDLNDVYGDDYQIYMLTSPFSFSCGNAYPFIAKKEGMATIIGQKSGGGECSVGSFLLPNGQMINMSSMNHIGYYSRTESSFIGGEGGAATDIQIPYEHYFDLDLLENYISKVPNAE